MLALQALHHSPTVSSEGTNMIQRERIQEQRETILFLAKLLAKAHTERDHARDVACAMEAEIHVLKRELKAIKTGG